MSNTTTTTTRQGRQVSVTSVTMFEAQMYQGVEIDRAICEVRTYDGEEDQASTIYLLSNGRQFFLASKAIINDIINGGN